jgi:Helicase conserved C-terminal domain
VPFFVLFSTPSPAAQVMVFFSSCNSVKFHAELLNYVDIKVLDIHGKQKQARRTATFFEFSQAATGTLLCTDVAARGLDIPAVDWIVQYDPPDDPKEYIHRVGRTARGEAGKGRALLFLMPEELAFLKYLKPSKVRAPSAGRIAGDGDVLIVSTAVNYLLDHRVVASPRIMGCSAVKAFRRERGWPFCAGQRLQATWFVRMNWIHIVALSRASYIYVHVSADSLERVRVSSEEDLECASGAGKLGREELLPEPERKGRVSGVHFGLQLPLPQGHFQRPYAGPVRCGQVIRFHDAAAREHESGEQGQARAGAEAACRAPCWTRDWTRIQRRQPLREAWRQ